MPSYLSSRKAWMVAGLQVVSCRLSCGGEAGDGFFGRVDGRGEHEAERVEEAHAGFAEGSGEGAAGRRRRGRPRA